MEDGGSYRFAGKRSLIDDEYAKQNGRRKRQNSLNDKPEVVDEIVYRILCPVNKIGILIGKRGSAINALREECRSNIKVEEPVSGCDERVVVISSAPDSVGAKESYACAAQKALFKIHDKITEPEDDDEPPQPVSFRLLVPKDYVGCLLGKGGRIIEQMRKHIGAQIKILPKDQRAPSAPVYDLVQVSGKVSLVNKALLEISTRLYENMSRGNSHRSAGASRGPDSTMLPKSAVGADEFYSPEGYLHEGAYATAIPGDPVNGVGYMHARAYADMNMKHASNFPLSASGACGAAVAGDAEEEFMIRLLCPNSRIGNIIGKGGNAINKVRDDTGAKIKIDDPIANCDERIIYISSREVVSMYPSPTVEAVMRVSRHLLELLASRDSETNSRPPSIRLLVPSAHIGCLLGKGGSIVSQMRKATKANIRISPKEELSECAKDNDELVQVIIHAFCFFLL
ncbi:hypothetical protein KP509_01G014300 [Ceratopteris richardii]|uniref:K Homology domain-containing protein n=1 Tax=Ceratopteris richardii TaxID=49495 RepID=A0A8T2VIU0_CERRI|nr:hypothetical protein KP509_01G014300 [Ceratopteris richardii]